MLHNSANIYIGSGYMGIVGAIVDDTDGVARGGGSVEVLGTLAVLADCLLDIADGSTGGELDLVDGGTLMVSGGTVYAPELNDATGGFLPISADGSFVLGTGGQALSASAIDGADIDVSSGGTFLALRDRRHRRPALRHQPRGGAARPRRPAAPACSRSAADPTAMRW